MESESTEIAAIVKGNEDSVTTTIPYADDVTKTPPRSPLEGEKGEQEGKNRPVLKTGKHPSPKKVRSHDHQKGPDLDQNLVVQSLIFSPQLQKRRRNDGYFHRSLPIRSWRNQLLENSQSLQT